MRSLLSLVLFLFAALVSAASTAGNRLLVVLDNIEEKDAYSIFFGDLSCEEYLHATCFRGDVLTNISSWL